MDVTVDTLHLVDGLGARWANVLLDGFDAMAGSTLTVTQKAKQHGGWRSSSPKLKPQPMALTGLVEAADEATMVKAWDGLKTVLGLEEFKVSVVLPDGSRRWVMASVQDELIPTIYQSALVKGFSVQLVAADPRKHQDPVSDFTLLPSVTGGLAFPHTIPYTIDSTVITGQVSLTNPGNIEGPVVARIDGPCTGVTAITHVGTGRALKFAEDLSMQSGEFLIIDMENETVLAQGQESRNNFVTERGWSSFDPGVNTWSFSSAGTDLGAKLTVAATPSWK